MTAAERFATVGLTEQSDAHDAARLVEAAVAAAALPGILSAAAREQAATRLRSLASENPMCSGVIWEIVRHLEQFQ